MHGGSHGGPAGTAGDTALCGSSPLTLIRFATAAGAARSPSAAPAERLRGDGLPLFWKTAALIGLLVLTAGRRTASGLALDLPARLLEREFGRGEVVRFEEVDFPATLTHEPTRRFLRETGLPENGFPFRHDTEMPLPTLAEYYECHGYDGYDGHGAYGTCGCHACEHPGALWADRLPDRAEHLIRVGRLADGSGVVVDAATGAVLAWREAEAALHPLASDLSTLVLTLWLLRRGVPLEAVAGIEPRNPLCRRLDG